MSTVYLATTGSDSYTYAQAQNPATPWLTPYKVETASTSGDSVTIAAGTYSLATTHVLSRSLTWNAPAVVNGKPSVFFDMGATTLGWWVNSTTQVFNNIQFQNGGSLTVVCYMFGMTGGSGSLTFNYCSFTNIYSGVAGIGGIALFQNGDGVGHSGTLPHFFNYCKFWNIYMVTVGNYFSLLTCSPACVHTVIGCTFVRSSTTSRQFTYICYAPNQSSAATSFKNCIFRSESGGGFWYAYGSGAAPTVTYSCTSGFSGAIAGTGNITTDPLIIDGVNGILNKKDTSPTIGTGTNS